MSVQWSRTQDVRPEDGTMCEVITEGGAQRTLYFNRGLWFLEDKSMYVYFTPELWREKKEQS